MTEQEQKIEEMAHSIYNNELVDISCYEADKIAEMFIEQGYQKIDKDSVVLTREEYTNYMVEYMGVKEIKDRVRRETAKEIWDIVMSDECSVEGTFDDTNFTQIIKERYGVEVEE